MNVAKLVVGPLQTNAYLIWETPEAAVLVDPGDEAAKVLSWLEAARVNLVAVLLTHAHFDHVGAVGEVVDKLNLPVYLHPKALPVYRRAAASAARWGFRIDQPPEDPVILLSAGELAVGPGFEVFHLPGHCPGHLAFYNAASQAIFSGDLLFTGGVGRWDIPSADRETLAASIRKLFALPATTTVYPGHGPETTLAAECQSNPYVREWVNKSLCINKY